MTSRRRRAPLPLRLLRGFAALSVVGLAGLVAYEGLRAAGFRFRWEVGREVLPPALDRVAARPELAGATPDRSATTPDPGRVEGASRTATRAEAPRSGEASGSPPDPAAGRGSFASIDFESFPDGTPACSPCPVSEEWSGQGLRLSFRSWSAESERPHLLDARNFLPDDAEPYALGPAFSEGRGLEVGVTRLDFPGRPRRVAFTLYGPDLIDRFDIAARSGTASLSDEAITRTLLERYRPAGRATFRAERVLVSWPDGIDHVSLDGWGPPGHVLLVDDLAIDP